MLCELGVIVSLSNYPDIFLSLVVLRINVDMMIFQPYLDLEAGDNQLISENSSGEAENRTPVLLLRKPRVSYISTFWSICYWAGPHNSDPDRLCEANPKDDVCPYVCMHRVCIASIIEMVPSRFSLNTIYSELHVTCWLLVW